MLARSMFLNAAEDRRDDSIGSANAFAAAMGSDAAQRQLAEPPAPEDIKRQASQAAAIGRLASIFNAQGRSALRGAIKFRKPN